MTTPTRPLRLAYARRRRAAFRAERERMTGRGYKWHRWWWVPERNKR